MKGSIGCPTRMIARIPHQKELARGGSKKELSKDAMRRLEIFDWYFLRSPKFSRTGKPDASLTCRHFGIHRSRFYYWKKRYNPRDLSSLEKRETTPKKKRSPEYSRELVRKVREIREKRPTYSGKKIRPILLRQMKAGEVPSVATLGRLISRESLFFRADAKRRKKRSKAAKTAHERKKKPYDLKPGGPNSVIEFDMKHVRLIGVKLYSLCAIDVFKKECLIYNTGSPTSNSGKQALKKVVERFGKNIAVVNDWGSENMKDAENYLRELGITQFWARPKHPKDKPHIERFIGTYQRECLDYHYEPMNVAELTEVTNEWLDEYHFNRPHESLGFLTPAEFSAKLNLSIPRRAGVS